VVGFYPRAMSQCGALPFIQMPIKLPPIPSGLKFNPSRMATGYYRRACASVCREKKIASEQRGRTKNIVSQEFVFVKVVR